MVNNSWSKTKSPLVYGNAGIDIQPFLLDAFKKADISYNLDDPSQPPDLLIVCSWPQEPNQTTDEALVNFLRKKNIPTIVILEAPDCLDNGYDKKTIEEWNKFLKNIASDVGAYLIPTQSKFLRWGLNKCLDANFQLSSYGAKAISGAVVKIISRKEATSKVETLKEPLTFVETGENLSEVLRKNPFLADELVFKMAPQLAVSNQSKEIPTLTSEEIFNTNMFISGKITFSQSYGWQPLAINMERINWAEEGPDRSWQSMFLGLDFLIHPLNVLDFLLSEYKLGRKIKLDIDPNLLLKKILDCFFSFKKSNPLNSPASPRAWHEGTASRRVRSLLVLLSSCSVARNLLSSYWDGALADIAEEISKTAHLLSTEEVYIQNGNHGVRQDCTIYKISRLFINSKESSRWRQLALERLKHRQFEKMLSADGVWLEHSTGYHALILNLLIVAEDIANQSNDTEAARFFNIYIQKMLKFFDFCLLPDSTLIRVGDTWSESYMSTAQKLSAYIANTNISSKNESFFKDAGYMFCRPPENERDSGIYLSFYCNLKSAKHKQADDLSIFIQEGYTPWLIDAGSLNVETSDQRRNAARFDPASHNTYRVNRKGYPFNPQCSSNIGFLSMKKYGSCYTACARNFLYERAEVYRFLVYIPNQKLCIVIDRLSSTALNEAQFEQFWHFAPAVQLTPEVNSFLANQENHPTTLSIGFDTSTDSWTQWEGSPTHSIGWTMAGWNKLIPNKVLCRTITTKLKWCSTTFQLKDGKQSQSIVKLWSEQDKANLLVESHRSPIKIQLDINGEIALEEK